MLPSYRQTWSLSRIPTIVLLLIACRAVQRSVPPPLQPTDQHDSTPTLAIQPVVSLPIWASFRANLTIHVQSTESVTSLRDSVTRHFQVGITPVQGITGNYDTHFHTTIPKGLFNTDSTVYTLTPNGQFVSPVIPVNCELKEVGFSPTYARFFIPRHSVTWPVVDTLRYSSCLRQLHTDLTVVHTWQQPALHGSTWAQEMQYSGSITADSSRILPLWMQGKMHGNAILWLHSAHLMSIDSARTDIYVLVHGLSSARQQQSINQTVSLQIIR